MKAKKAEPVSKAKKGWLWRRAPGGDIKACDAGRELERIRKSRGNLTPEVVVEEAANEGSVLHAAFQWDDALAAAEHRLQQARQLIKNIVIVVEDREPQTMYVHIHSEERREYVPLSQTAGDEELARLAAAAVQRRIDSDVKALEEILFVSGKSLTRKRKSAINKAKGHAVNARDALDSAL